MSLYLCVIWPTYHSNIVSDKINALHGSAARWRRTPAEWWALPNHQNYCSEQQRNMMKNSKPSSGEPKQTQPIKVRNGCNQRTNINPQQPSQAHFHQFLKKSEEKQIDSCCLQPNKVAMKLPAGRSTLMWDDSFCRRNCDQVCGGLQIMCWHWWGLLLESILLFWNYLN